jgi:hypothetical protein
MMLAIAISARRAIRQIEIEAMADLIPARFDAELGEFRCLTPLPNRSPDLNGRSVTVGNPQPAKNTPLPAVG